jgi:hypothetical protein
MAKVIRSGQSRLVSWNILRFAANAPSQTVPSGNPTANQHWHLRLHIMVMAKRN